MSVYVSTSRSSDYTTRIPPMVVLAGKYISDESIAEQKYTTTTEPDKYGPDVCGWDAFIELSMHILNPETEDVDELQVTVRPPAEITAYMHQIPNKYKEGVYWYLCTIIREKTTDLRVEGDIRGFPIDMLAHEGQRLQKIFFSRNTQFSMDCNLQNLMEYKDSDMNRRALRVTSDPRPLWKEGAIFDDITNWNQDWLQHLETLKNSSVSSANDSAIEKLNAEMKLIQETLSGDHYELWRPDRSDQRLGK